jgi:hypothetical protein
LKIGVDRHRNFAKIAGSPDALRRVGWEEKNPPRGVDSSRNSGMMGGSLGRYGAEGKRERR